MTINRMQAEEVTILMQQLVENRNKHGIIDELLFEVRRDANPASSIDMEFRRKRATALLQQLLEQSTALSKALIVTMLICVYQFLQGNHIDVDSHVHVHLQDLFSSMSDESMACMIQFIHVCIVHPNIISMHEEYFQITSIQHALQSTSMNDRATLPKEVASSAFWNKIIEIAQHKTPSKQPNVAVGNDEKHGCEVAQPTIVAIPPKQPKHHSIDDHTKNSQQYNTRASQEDIENIINAGDLVSEHIFRGAKFLQDGLANIIVPNVTKGIEALGDVVIQNTEPCAIKQVSDKLGKEKEKEDVELEEFVAMTDNSVKATDSMRQGARTLAYGIRDYSTRKVHHGTRAWNERELGKQLIPDDDVRETVVATGKVGLSVLGASALFIESMFETTKAIAQTSVKVASKVAEHSHGEEAGRVVNNAGVATGNVLRTITHVATLDAQILTETIARNTAKVEMKEKVKSKSNTSEMDASASICTDDVDDVGKLSSRPISRDLCITEDEQQLRALLNKPKQILQECENKIPEIIDNFSQALSLEEQKLKASINEILRNQTAVAGSASLLKNGVKEVN